MSRLKPRSRQELEDFEGLLDDISKVLPKIREETPWLYDYAYGQGRTGEQRTSGGDVSKPTESIAMSRAGARGVLRRALGKTRGARNALESAYELMAEFFDPEKTRDLSSRKGGSFYSDDQLKEIHAAKARREARGEGWGSG